MSSNQNIIHSSAINFAYGDKASASRCAVLIESIFESKILPELEKAIASKIPESVLVELSKLEINIGRIEEKEIPEKLAARIRESLENALYSKFDLKERLDPNRKIPEPRNQEKYLLESLELFLAKGYFPFDADKSADIDELMSLVLQQNWKGLLELLKKYGRNHSATRRIAHTLNEKTLDQLFSALDPVNSIWIVDFRKILIYSKNDLNFTSLSDAEFIQTINNLILNFLLNETSPAFNRENFSVYILNEIKSVFNPDLSTLVQSVKKQTDNGETAGLISKTLSKLQKETKRKQPTGTGGLAIDAEVKDQILRKSGLKTEPATGEISGDELFNSIELFLISGSLPTETEKFASVDELFSSALGRNSERLLKVIQKHSQYEAVVRRLVSNTKPELFDQLIKAIIPAESKWIFEFKSVLFFAQKESGLSMFRTEEFIRKIDFTILKYLLTKTGKLFNKQDFSEFVLKQFVSLPDSYFHRFAEANKSYPHDAGISEITNKTFDKSQHAGQDVFSPEKSKKLNLEKLAEALNSGQIDFKTDERDWMKNEIIRALSDIATREQFIIQLTEKGSGSLLEIFYPKRGAELQKLISAFVSAVVKHLLKANFEKLRSLKTKSVLETVWYSVARQNVTPDKEELILVFVHSSGLDDLETIKSVPFQHFVHTQKNVSLTKLRKLILTEKQLPEISAASDFWAKKQQTESLEKEAIDYQASLAEKYETIINRKIIGIYLGAGQLPHSYSDLTRQDLQSIFDELIRQSDEFLVIQFRKNESAPTLVKRLNELITNKSIGGIEEYLTHFFGQEFSDFGKLMDDLRQISPEIANRLSDKKLVISVFLSALAENKGVVSPEKFRLSVHKMLSLLFEIKFTEPEMLTYLLPDAANTELLKNKSRTNIAGIFEHLSNSKPDALKTFISLLAEDEKIFNEFISESKDFTLPAQLTFERKNTRLFLNQLIGFLPETTSKTINSTFWKSMVVRFALDLYIEDKKLAEPAFAESFMSHLQQKLSAINEGNLFVVIVDKMSSSSQKKIKELAELWQKNKPEEHSKKPDFNEPKEVEDLNYPERFMQLFPVLEFYGRNGFFPWWANQTTFGEIIDELHFLGQHQPDSLANAFIEAENEHHIFEKLLSKIPQRFVNELDQVFNFHTKLHSQWKEIKRKSPAEEQVRRSAKKSDIQNWTRKDFADQEMLYKAIYFEADNALLNQLFERNPGIQNQLKEYLSLASEFHFWMIKPIQWRKAVYEFALGYYKRGKSTPDRHFAVDFINHLRKKYAHIRWEESFKAIYRKLQSPNDESDLIFPEEIVQLFDWKQMQNPGHGTVENKQKNFPAIDETGLEIKVHNSGLVLFWPFLSRLFERLSLVENNEFITLESRNRAVYILQYLAFNEVSFPEYNLVLNKLLAGMPTEEHLNPFIELTKEEKDSTQSLLSGLISNWEKVKNSSPEAIQETFLRRRGTLKFQTDGVLLEVEKKTVDVLMSSIPWNTSVVKLPWMKKPVFVKWI